MEANLEVSYWSKQDRVGAYIEKGSKNYGLWTAEFVKKKKKKVLLAHRHTHTTNCPWLFLHQRHVDSF